MPSRSKSIRGWGSRKPGTWARPLEGHPLAPACAFLFNEGSGPTAYSWGRTGLQAPTAGTGGASSTTPQWGIDGIAPTGSTNQYQQISNDTALHFNRNFTVVARVMPSLAQASTSYAIVSWPNGGYYIRLVGNGTTDTVQFLQSRVAAVAVGSTGMTPNRWYTVGGTVSSGSTATNRVWIDGVADASATTTATFSATMHMRLGADTTGATDGSTASELFKGSIAWVYWYDRELTAPEMMAVHHQPYAWLSAGAPRRSFTNATVTVTSYPGSMLCHL